MECSFLTSVMCQVEPLSICRDAERWQMASSTELHALRVSGLEASWLVSCSVVTFLKFSVIFKTQYLHENVHFLLHQFLPVTWVVMNTTWLLWQLYTLYKLHLIMMNHRTKLMAGHSTILVGCIIFFLKLYAYGCFACIYIYVSPDEELTEARREHEISWIVSPHVGAGNWTQGL